jgi:hypothetical protein
MGGALVTHTRRSSRLPGMAGLGSSFGGVGLESFFGGVGLDSCLGGSGFDSCLGGAGLSSSAGLLSSFGLDCSCSPEGCDAVSWSLDAASFGSDDPSCVLPPDGSPPASSLTRSCPTVTVSSSLTRNSLIVPASGAFTATSILSVSMVAISSSCST